MLVTHPPSASRRDGLIAFLMRGWSLLELLTVLALVATGMQLALPTWQSWQARIHTLAARDRLMMDLQLARVQAKQLAHDLTLQATRDCAWHSQAANDWSCGWQLLDPVAQRTLMVTALSYPLQVRFTKNVPLDINARGDLGQVGDRWTLQARTSTGTIAHAICLSGAGRLRTVASPTCS